MNIKYPITSTFLDYPDNESLAVILYIMGCDNNCINCHNPEFQDRNYNIGTKNESYYYIAYKIIKNCSLFKTNKIVISGGDPLYKENIEDTKKLIKELNFYTPYCYDSLSFDVCLYTGKDIEYIKKLDLPKVKFIKCGKYIEELKQKVIKNDEYMQFASMNQELYDSDYNLLTKNSRYYYYK